MAKDKMLHFVVGFAISLVVAVGSVWFGQSPWVGFVAAALAGVVKEIMDRFSAGHEEFVDFWWTGFGGLLAVLLVLEYN